MIEWCLGREDLGESIPGRVNSHVKALGQEQTRAGQRRVTRCSGQLVGQRGPGGVVSGGQGLGRAWP